MPELLHREPERCYQLTSDFAKRRLLEAIDSLPIIDGPSCFEIVIRRRVEFRSKQQNDLLHAILEDIADQAQLGGDKRSPAVWKEFLARLYLPTLDEPIPGGDVRQIRTSTMTLDRSRFSEFIEAVSAHAATLGVKLSDRARVAVDANRLELRA